MSTRVIKVDPSDPKSTTSAANQGAEALQAGRLVAFATETVYGIAAVASDTAAMERLRELKSRPERPFSVHIPWPEDVRRYVADVAPMARADHAGSRYGRRIGRPAAPGRGIARRADQRRADRSAMSRCSHRADDAGWCRGGSGRPKCESHRTPLAAQRPGGPGRPRRTDRSADR